MDIQKMATYGTAAAVLGTGATFAAIKTVDTMKGGPQQRLEAQATELRQIVREEVQAAIREAWPTRPEYSPELGKK